MDVSWTDRVRKILQRVMEERNFLQATKRSKANRIDDILCRSCLLKHVTEGKIEGCIEVTGRRRRKRRNLLDDLQEMRGYWKMKNEVLDLTVWRTRFGRGYGCVEGVYRMNE